VVRLEVAHGDDGTGELCLPNQLGDFNEVIAKLAFDRR
jgi:hypothetical protein